MGETQFDLGHYDYSNYLLNISESEVAGHVLLTQEDLIGISRILR